MRIFGLRVCVLTAFLTCKVATHPPVSMLRTLFRPTSVFSDFSNS
jgi:hypothetical protein